MTLRLNGSTSGYVEIDAPATAGSNTLTLPNGNGTNGQYLQTNGSGALSWATVSSTVYQGPAFKAYKSGGSTTSVTASTWTKIILDAETFDTDGCFDSTTNYRFTPTKAGYYKVTGQVYANWSGSQPSRMQVAVYKNGSENIRGDRTVGTSASDYGSQWVHDLIYLNGSSDYIELYYWSNASGPTYTEGSSNTVFQGYWVHS